MLYEIIKVTLIDSVHEEKAIYARINASDEDVKLSIIPMLNKLVDAINMNYKLMQSLKRVHFVIKPILYLDVINAIVQIDMDINANIHSYNASAAIANRRSSVHNKKHKNGIKYPMVKVIDRRDFDNPFVNYGIVYIDAKTKDYMALGRE